MKVYDFYIWKKFWENIHEWSWLLAESEEEAKKLLEEEYWLQWMLQFSPVRKNQKKDMYRVSLYEKWNIEMYIKDMTKKNECNHCKRIFRKMTHKWYYSNFDSIYCSYDCFLTWTWLENKTWSCSSYSSSGVVYRIYKKSTWESYIWQTIRSWTLRWWEHFTQWTSPKFQNAIRSTPLNDWSFEIIEVIEWQYLSQNQYALSEAEEKWIRHFNSIENWFNTRSQMKK